MNESPVLQWAAEHKNWAAWFLCRVAGRAARGGKLGLAERLVFDLSVAAANEERLRQRLAEALTPARIESGICLVRDLAEGRRKLETGWGGKTWKGTTYPMPDRAAARSWVDAVPSRDGRRVVRKVCLTRKARRPA